MEQGNSEKTNIRIDNNPDKKLNLSSVQNQIKQNPWMISTIIIGIIALILLIMVFSGGITGNVISQNDMETQALEFINTQLLQGQSTAELVSIIEESGLYVVNVAINDNEFPIYFTKDGKYISTGYGLISLTDDTLTNSETETETAEVPKSDKPVVELYVFTYCPYGTQAEKGIIPVAQLLGDKIDFKIRQIGAMHGEYEAIEAKRQLCINKLYPDKYLEYTLALALDSEVGSCGGDATCVAPLIQKIYTKLGIDKTKIDSCMKTDADALYATEEANSEAQGVSGSPTLLINGVNAQSSRDSASYLKTICSAFNTAPEECSKTLSSASPSAGFGASTSSASSSASC
ncbi:MAG: hypothetical protein WCX73_02280 [Candidatus Pacearchaeota archaeon]|jgi:hypothetical protein